MPHLALRASARALVLSVALAGPLAVTVPSYAAPGAGSVVSRVVADVTPVDLSAQQLGRGEVYLSWQPNEDVPSEGYEARLVPSDGSSGPDLSEVVDVETLDVILTEVPVGTYDFYVTPRVGDGGEAPSAVLEDVEVVETPDAVTAFAATQTAPGVVTVTWKAPEPNGVEVDGYLATIAASQNGRGDTVGPDTFTQTWDALRPGRYTFTASALTGEIPGPAQSAVVVVTNAVKSGAPTIRIADARLKPRQKLAVTGKAAPRSQVQLEFKPAGEQDFFVVGEVVAARSGAYRIVGPVPSGGVARTVAVATGRVSPEKTVTVTRTGR